MLVLKYDYQSPHTPGSFLIIDPKQVLQVSNVRENEIRIDFVNNTWKYIGGNDLSAHLMITLLDSALRNNTFIYRKVEFVSDVDSSGGNGTL